MARATRATAYDAPQRAARADIEALRLLYALIASGENPDGTPFTLPVSMGGGAGTYGYAAGVAAATVDVPAGARVRRVWVVAGTGDTATITIAGGATITVPGGTTFDEALPGDTTAGADVVIGGTLDAYYVAWTT